MLYTFCPKKNKILFTLVGLCLSLNLLSQSKNIDSLLTLIKTDNADTNKVKHLNTLSRLFMNQNPDTAIILGNQALNIITPIPSSEFILTKEGIEKKEISRLRANTLSIIGTGYLQKGDYRFALDYFTKALKIDDNIKDKSGLAKRLGNIGIVYKKQGDYPKALDYYLTAQRIYEELGLKTDIAINLGNIGNIYRDLGDYSKALDYSFKAQKIYEELGLKINAAKNIGNIGGVYFKQKDYTKAFDYTFQALKMTEAIGDTSEIARHLGNIGNIYSEQAYSLSPNYGELVTREELFSKALTYHFKALKMREKLGSKNLIASTLESIGSLYTSLKKYNLACNYLYNSLSIYMSIGAKNGVKDCYEDLSELYEKSTILLPDSIGGNILSIEQMRLKALYYNKQYAALRDEIFSEENKKQLVRIEMNYAFYKKEAVTKVENEKKQAIAEEKNRKQKIIIWSVVSGLLLLLVLTGFILRSLRITRKQKQIIEIQNSETLQQKKIIEEKNKNITDSINYAKRIQNALLREQEHISLHLPEHFILFLPKDIVSGDFYWGAEKQEYWYFTVADCTGHGVPGAIMSMLGISFLNDIVISGEEVLSPSEILNKLREKVIKELRQTDESVGNKDGMDISLCRINLKTFELQWAGANNSLNLLRNGQLEKIKADKQPIGYHPGIKPFMNHEIKLLRGDCIYIYSDGYSDQFGGSQEKKFGYKKLENLFMAHNHIPMREQKDIFRKCFVEWRGQIEQTDDVCVFGVRV